MYDGQKRSRRKRRLRRPVCSSLLLLLAIGISGGCTTTTQSLNADGVRLFQQARYQEALQRFGQALIYDPNDPVAYYNIASVYHRMGDLYHRGDDYTRAATYYQLALAKDPNHLPSRRGLTVLLTGQGKSQEAVAMLQNWAGANPSSPEPRVELARLYEEIGDRDSAKKCLLEALALDPHHVRALNALGHIREVGGEKELALTSYEQSLQLDGRQPELALRVAALRNELQLAQRPSSPLGTVSQPLR